MTRAALTSLIVGILLPTVGLGQEQRPRGGRTRADVLVELEGARQAFQRDLGDDEERLSYLSHQFLRQYASWTLDFDNMTFIFEVP